MPRSSSAWYGLSFLLMLGLLAGYAEWRDIRGLYVKYEQSEQEVRRLREELETREREEAQLKRSVANLSSDPVEWEANIRRNQGLVREGEKVYRVDLAPTPRASQ